MILKNSLYKISSSYIEEKSFNLELVPDCLIYKAHFPEQPITPGVCIIQIASELLNELLQEDYELTGVSNAKFLAVISPAERKSINYTFRKIVSDEERNTVKVSVVVSDSSSGSSSGSGVVFTKLSLAYRKK